MYQVPRVREIIAKVMDHLARCGVLSTAPVLVSTHVVETVKLVVYFVRLFFLDYRMC